MEFVQIFSLSKENLREEAEAKINQTLRENPEYVIKNIYTIPGVSEHFSGGTWACPATVVVFSEKTSPAGIQ